MYTKAHVFADVFEMFMRNRSVPSASSSGHDPQRRRFAKALAAAGVFVVLAAPVAQAGDNGGARGQHGSASVKGGAARGVVGSSNGQPDGGVSVQGRKPGVSAGSGL